LYLKKSKKPAKAIPERAKIIINAKGLSLKGMATFHGKGADNESRPP
jgi:hypothetical protein